MQPLRIVLLALRRPSLERPTGAIGRALDRLDAVIYDELAQRRAQQDLAERTDILSLLMQARDEDGQPMTDDELRDELVTLLLAGHETTATSVAWAIERLVRHPRQARAAGRRDRRRRRRRRALHDGRRQRDAARAPGRADRRAHAHAGASSVAGYAPARRARA